MPHATEGELHAYIDGALRALDPGAAERLETHLATCADCRAEAEAARSVRDRSRALLETALGEVGDPPPFETILQEAEGRRGATGSSITRLRAPHPRGLAWAASLLVALGAGWMANALLENDVPVTATDEVTALRDAPTAAGDEAGRELEEAFRPADELRAPTEAPAAAELRASAEPAPDRAAAERPAAEAMPEPTAVGRASALADQDDRAAEADVPDDEALASAAWRTAGLEEAAAWIGSELRRLPELTIVDAGVAEVEGRRLARLRQRLPGGETLEILQEGVALRQDVTGAEGEALEERGALGAVGPRLRSRLRTEPAAPEPGAARREAAAPPPPPASTGWFDADGARIRLSAPVAPDSLTALLLRIR